MIAPLPPSVRSTDRRLRFLASAYRLLLDDLWRMVNHAPTPLVSEVDGEYARGHTRNGWIRCRRWLTSTRLWWR